MDFSDISGSNTLSTLKRIEATIPRVSAKCYVCGSGFTTYYGVDTVPPDPCRVFTSEQIGFVATCKNPYCHEMETKRQDALFQVIIAPIREKYYADRDARISASRGAIQQEDK